MERPRPVYLDVSSSGSQFSHGLTLITIGFGNWNLPCLYCVDNCSLSQPTYKRKEVFMRSIAQFLILLVLLILPLSAPVWAQSPPLIDRELFFGDPEIAGAQISPDGAFIAFIKPFKGTRNVWVKKTAEPFDKAKPITADTKRPIPTYFWSQDGKFILFVQDKAGDENYNVYAVNPSEAPASGQDVPAARYLTAVKGIRAFIYSVPRR